MSLFSLKSLELKKEGEKIREKVVFDKQNLPYNSYTEQEFFAVWERYLQMLTDEGERIEVALLGRKVIISNDVIQLKTSSEASKKEILNRKERILNFVRKELLNYNIELTVTVDEELVIRKTAFSEREKYEALLIENPLLNDLRVTLELDFK